MRNGLPDFSTANIVDCLRHFAGTQPDHPAMEDGDIVISYKELNKRTDEAAGNIRAAGIAVGEIAAVILQDSIEHLIVNCGLARAGVVMFSLNTSSSISDIESAMAAAGSRLLITDIAANHADNVLTDIRRFPLAEICAESGAEFAPAAACGDQPLVLIQSSGTTGEPKSFFGTHRQTLHQITAEAGNNMPLNNSSIGEERFEPTDRYLNLSDMCLHFSRAYYFCALNVGCTLILRRIDTFDDLPRFARNKKVTYVQATSFHVVTLLKLANVEEMLLPDLRVLCTSTAPVSPEQRQRARQHITANICEIYGGNEFGSVSWATPEDQDKYPQSVGRVIEQVDVEIVDDESRALPVGEVGLVRFRTPGAVKGYIDNPVMTAHHFRDGWFYPGDVARMNAEGYLFLLGRADDIINNTGIKFYPIEVETVLLNYPGVREAAVFAYPHEIAGQLAAAVVVADDDVDLADLRAHATQHLAAHKIPWLMSKANSLPRNKMGKVLKRRLARALQSRHEAKMAPYSK